ncbi:MAG: TRL-like family protein [Chloroherpetonaceae bacterium]|nr:TRL-like family protein [Chloroherpetonaceae bacterium]MDW8438201.1 TRL-like family protein [Chloroherpetonaceae bacterium]
MKKNLALFASALFVALTLSACSITTPVAVSSNPVGPKVGKASGTVYLGILAFGVDVSIQKAAKNGGITKISTVDIQHDSILGLVDTYTVIVTGE